MWQTSKQTWPANNKSWKSDAQLHLTSYNTWVQWQTFSIKYKTIVEVNIKKSKRANFKKTKKKRKKKKKKIKGQAQNYCKTMISKFLSTNWIHGEIHYECEKSEAPFLKNCRVLIFTEEGAPFLLQRRENHTCFLFFQKLSFHCFLPVLVPMLVSISMLPGRFIICSLFILTILQPMWKTH